MVVPDVEGVCRDEVVPFEDLHVVNLEPGPEPVAAAGGHHHPVGDQPGGTEEEEVAELKGR